MIIADAAQPLALWVDLTIDILTGIAGIVFFVFLWWLVGVLKEMVQLLKEIRNGISDR